MSNSSLVQHIVLHTMTSMRDQRQPAIHSGNLSWTRDVASHAMVLETTSSSGRLTAPYTVPRIRRASSRC
jgi:hypothetical protein